MKLLLIKIGKAWNVIKRDGFWHGGKRVLLAFFGLFRRVKPGDILFVSNGVGDSARYRTTYVAEELRNKGFSVSVTLQDNPFLLSYGDKFSIFIFHRILYTPSVAKLIEKIKQQKKEIIFDADDLIFDPQFLPFMNGYDQMNVLERKLYEHGVGGEILADPYVTTCTASTNFLAQKLREKNKRVFVVRNTLSEQDTLNAEEVLLTVRKDASVVRVSYLSGTPSHNKDFATITKALTLLLEKYPEMRLVLAGPLDTEDALQEYASRIERVPFLTRKKYFAMVGGMDINLAPLEIGNPFCESKSELKWFEAGLMAVPTVASATGTFLSAIKDGVDGYVARTTDEWVAKLSLLIEDKARREKMGAQARETVLESYTTKKAENREYYAYLRSKIVE